MRYIKKPVIIDAVQWNGENINDIKELKGNLDNITLLDRVLTIRTLEGDMTAIPSDYIIKGVKGEIYPCKEDIFHETYDIVEDI